MPSNLPPIAADDLFTVQQGTFTTTVTGHLGHDNGNGVDSEPDGGLLGWASVGFNPVGDGNNYLGAFFSNGVLGFLSLQQSGYVTFPVFSTSLLIITAQGGQVVLQTNGSFTYTAPAGFSGVDWFDYTLVDEQFGTDIARVTFNVLETPGANHRPDAMADVFVGNEDVQITGNVLADNGNGVDTDRNGDALTVKNHTIFTTKGGLVSIYANGDFVYRPPANFNGTDSFSYTVTDTHGASNTGTVTLDLAAVNDAPTARNDSFSGVHSQPISGNVLSDNGSGADFDAENDILTVVPATLSTANGGTVTLLADGNFTYIPNASFVGIDSFTYSVGDGNGNSSSAIVTLNVFNTAPVARTDWFVAQFGKGISGNVLRDNGTGADSDADGDALSVTAGTFATAHGGIITISANGGFRYTPAEAFYGTDSFQYTVRDQFGGVSTNTVLINTYAPVGSRFGTTGEDNIVGTTLGDFVFGQSGDDTVSGLDGDDVLAGGGDKDTIYGDAGIDKLYGQAGKDLLQGGFGNDLLSGGLDADDLFGGAGGDRLIGGSGIDTLVGGAGADKFIFDAATGLSYDRVQDFRLGDKLCVIGSHYDLAKGALPDASYFATGPAAIVDHGRFIYTEATRSLSWDADGNAATTNAIIAIFDNPVSLSYTDFLVL